MRYGDGACRAASAPAENLPAERQMPGTDLRKCERPPPPPESALHRLFPIPANTDRGNHIFQCTRLVTHGISISVSRGLCPQVAYPTEAPTINPFRRKRLHAKTGNIGNSKTGTVKYMIGCGFRPCRHHARSSACRICSGSGLTCCPVRCGVWHRNTAFIDRARSSRSGNASRNGFGLRTICLRPSDRP